MMQAVSVALIAFAAPPPLRGVSRCAVCCAAPQDGPPTPYAADVPYREGEYDPAAADAFFRQRPMAVLRRVVQLTRLSGGFVFAVILDKVLKREEQMTEQRSQALLELVTKLGPAFIKLCERLSLFGAWRAAKPCLHACDDRRPTRCCAAAPPPAFVVGGR